MLLNAEKIIKFLGKKLSKSNIRNRAITVERLSYTPRGTGKSVKRIEFIDRGKHFEILTHDETFKAMSVFTHPRTLDDLPILSISADEIDSGQLPLLNETLKLFYLEYDPTAHKQKDIDDIFGVYDNGL